eukprot:SAG22_NODE_4276_length_1320_cov_0.717445_1_plen_282_part_00
MSFVAGAIAGAIDTCVTMPLDTVKTQMQINKEMGKSAIGCAKTIVKMDGVAGLYKGFAPFVVQASRKAAVRFMCYDTLTGVIDGMGIDRSQNAALWSLTCGTGAGMVEARAWTCPSERLKVLQQSTAGTGGKVPSYGEVIKVQGIRGLYVGAVPTAGRQATSVAVRFTMVDQVKSGFVKAAGIADGSPVPWYVTFMAGGAGGACSVVLNNPIDVVKSKIQSGYKGGVVSCVGDIIKERGMGAFAAGLSARVPRLFLSQAIQFSIVDVIKEQLGVGKADKKK